MRARVAGSFPTDCGLSCRVFCAVSWRGQDIRYTALLTACAYGHLDVVTWLVTNAHSDAASERDRVSPPLFSLRVTARATALLFDCVVCAVHILAVAWRRGKLGATALLVACRDGHLAVVQWLVTSAHSDAASERDSASPLLLSPSLHVPALF
jgi:ankyrin repeat protein